MDMAHLPGEGGCVHSPGVAVYTWETTLQELFGSGFEMYNRLLTEHTTLSDILSHRTGIPDYFVPLMAVLPERETREKLVWRVRYHKPIYDLRQKFRYNNFMYMLGGYAAELLKGGEHWNSLIRKHIFEPLQMTSSGFSDEFSDWNKLAAPYVFHDGELIAVDKVLVRQTNGVGPAGSILSNGEDMAKWLKFHLNKGVADDGTRLVDEGALEETYQERMISPHYIYLNSLLRNVYPVSDVHIGYNMGWITNNYRGHKRIWHSGSIATYKSQVWLYPDAGFGIYVNINGPPSYSTSTMLKSLLWYISDIVLGETPWLNVSTICTFPAPWKNDEKPQATALDPLPNDKPPRDLNTYTGVYGNPGFGDVLISLDDNDQLKFKMGQLLEATLHYNATQDIFFTNMTGAYVYLGVRVPIQFSKYQEGSGYEVAQIPLYLPFDQAEPIPFFRGNSTEKYNKVREKDYGRCTSGCKYSNTVDFKGILLLLTVFLIMTY